MELLRLGFTRACLEVMPCAEAWLYLEENRKRRKRVERRLKQAANKGGAVLAIDPTRGIG